MSISEEFVRLQELHERGTLTDAEFADAKAKVLAGEAPVSPVEIQRLQIQGEILRLDQDWAEERTRHMMYGRSGPACIPTIGNSVGPALLIAVITLFFIAAASSARQPSVMQFDGLFFLAIAFIFGMIGVLKTKAYNTAHDHYQQQRSKLTEKLEALR